MNRETALAAAGASVLVVALVAAVAVPGALADPTSQQREPPARVGVAEVAVSPGEVTGETAELRLRTRLDHAGGTAENVTVRYRAVDAESGLLEAERTVEVGTVSDGEVPVEGALVVPREGGYRLRTTVFVDGERVAESETSVRGVEALRPPYARTTVGFAEGRVFPDLAVAVEEAGDNRTRLRVTAWVTNEGDEPNDDLRLAVLVRQAESNVVADEAEATVREIRPGRTDTVSVTVTVPDGYNYFVDAALYNDGVRADETQGVANLDPTRTLEPNETREEVEFEVGDFEEDGGRSPEETSTEAPARTEVEDETPGFGPVVAVVALLAAALLAVRARREP